MIFNVGDKPRRNVLVSTDHGMMIVNRFDGINDEIGHGRFLLDHGNANTVEAYECYKALKDTENPCIFDIGANIGTVTTWLAQAFPSGRIYCFEPQRAVFQQLAGNIAINNLYNVYTYNIGLGAKNSWTTFREPNYFAKFDYGMFTLNTEEYVPRGNDTYTVEIKTLDTFMDQHCVDRVDLLKIDVEGMDVEVLQGAAETIKKFRPKIFIEYSNGITNIYDQIITELAPYGYDCEIIGNNVLAK